MFISSKRACPCPGRRCRGEGLPGFGDGVVTGGGDTTGSIHSYGQTIFIIGDACEIVYKKNILDNLVLFRFNIPLGGSVLEFCDID